MSLNTSNTPDGRGVLIYNGEVILLYSKDVTMSFNNTQGKEAFKGKKSGSLYLTSHRIIFMSECSDGLRSFAMPFYALREVKLEQPILMPNYLKGSIVAQPGGNFEGEIQWKLSFSKGGCVDFGQALLQAAELAQRFRPYDAPPMYAPATGNFYAAPPNYYIPPPGNYHGFNPPTHAFPDQPPAGNVFMYETPPPYPGIAQNAPLPAGQLHYAGQLPPGQGATGFSQQGYAASAYPTQNPPPYPEAASLPQKN